MSALAERLLARACARYDADPRLAEDARALAWAGFGGGLVWMERCAGSPAGASRSRAGGHLLGLLKYGLCLLFSFTLAAPPAFLLLRFAPALALLALPLAVLAFYALESRWVFVFPAAAHGEARPFLASWRLTRKAGGTLAAMAVVLPVAAWMLGLRGTPGAPLRAWATGCLAVLLWYEELTGRR